MGYTRRAWATGIGGKGVEVEDGCRRKGVQGHGVGDEMKVQGLGCAVLDPAAQSLVQHR